MRKVTNYFFEMTASDQLRERPLSKAVTIVEAKEKEYRFNRYLYQLVGEHWSWTDRLELSDEEWQDYAEHGATKTFVAYVNGGIAGYYELHQHKGGDVQLVYFGLAPRFIGRGIGAGMLSHALKTAWAMPGTERVWLYTCSDDHPNAMKNYKARGLRLFKTETKEVAEEESI